MTRALAILRAAIVATKHAPVGCQLQAGHLRVLEALLDRLPDDTPRPVNADDVSREIGMRPAHVYHAMKHLDRAGFLARGTRDDGRRTYRLTLPDYHQAVVRPAA